MQPPRTTPLSPQPRIIWRHPPQRLNLPRLFTIQLCSSLMHHNHAVLTTLTGLPYQLILGSRRLARTNHSFQLPFDVQFLEPVQPHAPSFCLPIARGATYAYVALSRPVRCDYRPQFLARWIVGLDIFYRGYLVAHWRLWCFYGATMGPF